MKQYFLLTLCLAFIASLFGCRASSSAPLSAAQQSRQQQQQQAHELSTKENAAREELDQIPPPSKTRYLAVHTPDGWVNPFLTIHRDTVELRIFFPQTPGSPVDGGSSLLHPEAARKQVVDVRLSDLPEALAAVPGFSWPYGRVVAVQESEAGRRQDRAQVRRNEEAAMQVLNNLGIVVDEWTGSASSLIH